MLNREKFATEILDITCKGNKIAICNGKLTACIDTHCINCDFKCPSDCNEKTLKWANGEYIEQPVDWSKVPIDTPVLVRDYEDSEWTCAYFAGQDDECGIRTWVFGATSWSVAKCPHRTVKWKYAKLAESEE